MLIGLEEGSVMKYQAYVDRKNKDAPTPALIASDIFITAFSDASWSPRTKHFGVGVWIKSSEGVHEHGFGGVCESSHEAESLGLACVVSYLLSFDIKDKVLVIQCDNISALNQIDQASLYTKGAKFVKLKHVKGHTGLNTNRSKVNDWCDKRASFERKKQEALKDKDGKISQAKTGRVLPKIHQAWLEHLVGKKVSVIGSPTFESRYGSCKRAQVSV